MKNADGLPMKNSHELDRTAVSILYGWTKKEIDGAAWAFKAMYQRQPSSTITFKEYLDAIASAGLRPSMVGKRRGQYQFARYGDTGAYTKDAARFVPQLSNQMEKSNSYQGKAEIRAKISASVRAVPKIKCGVCGVAYAPGMLVRWHGANCKSNQGA